MANSDNVLRAGLTPKYIDIPELVANVKFEAKPAGELLTQPQRHGAELDFPIPVEDFASPCMTSPPRPAIWPCKRRSCSASTAKPYCAQGDQSLTSPGESAFVAASESPVQVAAAAAWRAFSQAPVND